MTIVNAFSDISLDVGEAIGRYYQQGANRAQKETLLYIVKSKGPCIHFSASRKGRYRPFLDTFAIRKGLEALSNSEKIIEAPRKGARKSNRSP
jgi:hypothetical protein